MIGLLNTGPGLGDKIQFASLPEIFYHNTGEKVIDMSRCWVYDYNPYVVREGTPTEILNLWGLSHHYKADAYLSTSERFFLNSPYSQFKVTVRHPKLYRYDDVEPIPGRVVVHTTGRSEGGQINDEVINVIAKRYRKFEVIQIGGREDKPTPFINKLGLGIWETVAIIASATIFIGVDSGAGMGIANCFPHLNRKVVLNRKDFDTFYPLNRNTGWLDFNVQYFNQTPDDIGTTYSYTKI